MARGCLLESQRFACSEKANRLLQTPGLCFLALGGLDPADIPSPMRGRKPLKVPPRRRLSPQGCLNVLRKRCGHLEPWRSRAITAVRRGALDPTGLQLAAGFQCRVALPISRRPPAIRLPRRELARVA